MRYIGFEREEDAELWVRQRLGITSEPTFFRAMSSIGSDGEFVCVVVLTGFSERNVDINLAMDIRGIRPKELMRMYNEVFGFVFDRLRVSRVTALIPGQNRKSAETTARFGFVHEGVMRKALANDDLHIYGMTADDFRAHAWYRKQQ